jgi:hypothetical protein
MIGEGHEIRLAGESRLDVTSWSAPAKFELRIGPGATLSGTGAILARSFAAAGPLPLIVIDEGGKLAPGGEKAPGTLRVGESGLPAHLKLQPQSTLKFRINNSREADRIVLNGTLEIEETNLEIVSASPLRPTDRVFLVVVESGEINGHPIDAAHGKRVPVTFTNGTSGTAEISLRGDAKTNSLEGGSDLVIHDFRP